MDHPIPETNKKQGRYYAWTDDGLELPVIDLTNPAFTLSITDEQLSDLIDKFVKSTQRLASLSPEMLRPVLENSLLMRGMLVDSAGTYTSGIMTYLNKLGAENLGEGYASALDRQWAGSLTPTTFRWRMRDLVTLLADGLAGALAVRPSLPVCLLNIGGGPAADSLNALLRLQKNQPDLLTGRQIRILVLDLDSGGPHFGQRCLDALQADGAPLQGLDVSFEHIPYNWADTSLLSGLLERIDAKNMVAAGSSEGGLFEFASDEQIVANLQALHQGVASDFVMVGPVVRDASTLDPRLRMTEHVPGRPAIRYLGLETFGKLVEQAGWQISAHLDSPMHQVVSLSKK